VLAGGYPAFYLSGAQALSVMQGNRNMSLGSGVVRKILVVTQFAISIVLLVATGVVFSQLDYARSLDLGYDKEQTVIIGGMPRMDGPDSYEAFRNKLLQHSNITSVAYASLMPTDDLFSGSGFRRPGDPPDSSLFYRVNAVGYDYFETLGSDMAAGRTFSREFGTDARTNPSEENPHEQAAKDLNAAGAAKAGWTPDEAIGKEFIQGDDAESVTYTVVGVTEDIYFSSIHNAIEPVVYFLQPVLRTQLAIKLSTADLPATLDYIDRSWNEVVPAYPITRTFLDTRFDALYEAEAREATVFTSFAILAVVIACLGLLGLAAFMAERRRKEIGVRKVLGASVKDIMLLLSWDFTKLVILANLIAWPAAYFIMRAWLDSYAYQVDLGVGLFVLAGAITFMIAWGTIAWQAGRAALLNPVDTIRSE
jgi:putative ABC transport system permease protein